MAEITGLNAIVAVELSTLVDELSFARPDPRRHVYGRIPRKFHQPGRKHQHHRRVDAGERQVNFPWAKPQTIFLGRRAAPRPRDGPASV